MIDSYLAPVSLAAARKRLESMAGRVSDGGEIVKLSTRPFPAQQHLITATADAVMADLVLWSWDQDSLQALAERLQPGTVLLFLEPTAELGWRRVVHRYGRVPARLLLRHHFEADIPAALREAGLIVTTTVRFGTGPAGWRSYVLGRAEHIT